MGSVIAALVTIPMLADLVTASAAGEWVPLGQLFLQQPLMAFAVKVAEIALLLSIVDICRRRHPRIGWFVVACAVIAGSLGTLSNT